MTDSIIIEPCPATRSEWRKDWQAGEHDCYVVDSEHVTVYYNSEVYQHATIDGATVFNVKAVDQLDTYADGPTTSVAWTFHKQVSEPLPATGVDPMVGIGGGLLGVLLIIAGAAAFITRKRKA
ncbi:membrane protein [Microbacterium phage Morrill]|nr:membrane protein [Microbacterium phage Morrill]